MLCLIHSIAQRLKSWKLTVEAPLSHPGSRTPGPLPLAHGPGVPQLDEADGRRRRRELDDAEDRVLVRVQEAHAVVELLLLVGRLPEAAVAARRGGENRDATHRAAREDEPPARRRSATRERCQLLERAPFPSAATSEIRGRFRPDSDAWPFRGELANCGVSEASRIARPSLDGAYLSTGTHASSRALRR